MNGVRGSICFARVARIQPEQSHRDCRGSTDAKVQRHYALIALSRSLVASPLWLGGFITGGVAVALLVVSYSLTSIAVVQAIFGAGLALLVVASRVLLREHLSTQDYVGLAITIGAVALVSATLTSTSAPGTGGTIVLVSWVSAVTVAAAGGAFLAIRSLDTDVSLSFGVASGLLYGAASLQVKGASVIVEHRGVLSAIPRILSTPYPYVFLITSILGLLTFQTGLQRSRVALVGSITNVVAAAYTVAIGTAVFREGLPHNEWVAAVRYLGLALVLVGGWVIGRGQPGNTNGEPENYLPEGEPAVS